jgi:DNA adenine methylase
MKIDRHKTPLRYPGGKQRLAPFILEIIEANGLVGCDYAEPYAGGAGVAIELLLNGKVGHVHLNDTSRAVHFFWYAILNSTDDFCRLISDSALTVEEWRRQKEILSRPSEFNSLELGFSLFYLNRCNRSGIPNGGVIGGLDQKGNYKMDARFPRKKLVARVEAIAAKKALITLKNWDAEKFILEHVPKLPEKSLVYCDPPYFHQGRRLYLSHYKPADHERIAKVIETKLNRPWVVSYDGVPEILRFYSERRSFLYDLQYNAQRVHKGKEVFVFSDDLKLPPCSSIVSVNDGLRLA